MSRSVVRKLVIIEAQQDDDSLPTENQKIVRVLKSRGNNLHEVETPDKSVLLASMPKRFRACVWVKKGDFVVVEPIEEGNKVKAEIVKILSKDQIKLYKTSKVWPEEFIIDTDDKKEQDDDPDDLFVNPNRPRVSESDTSSSDSSSCSDADDDKCENSDSDSESENGGGQKCKVDKK